MKAELIYRDRHTLKEGQLVEIVIWQVPASVPPCLHRYKYRLVYIINGTRVVGFDNERGKGDHYHVGDDQYSYVFRGIPYLLADFDAEVKRWKS